MSVRVRFAPSPTGYLHVGNVRTALYNWLFARRHGGSFIVRIEDTDAERSKTQFETDLMDDLRWLGLDWDEGIDTEQARFGPYRQSERGALYERFAGQLLNSGDAYYCFCGSDELEAHREKQLKAGRQPHYSGRCRQIAAPDAKRRVKAGEPAILRLRVRQGTVRFTDAVFGDISVKTANIDDFILVRSNGHPQYNFACVVDDAQMKISHVIRGEGHLSNTSRQLLIWESLGWSPPQFAHLSTILGPDGSKLSKRHGATSIRDFRDQGYLASGLVNYLALLGWTPPEEAGEILMPEQLASLFELENVHRSPATFDPEKLNWVNRSHLQQTAAGEVARLALPFFVSEGLLDPEYDEATTRWIQQAVAALVKYVSRLDELPGVLLQHLSFTPQSDLESADSRTVLEMEGGDRVMACFRKLLADLPPEHRIDADTYRELVTQVRAETGIRGKHLFKPIRVAVTGRTAGLELESLIPLVEEAVRLHLPFDVVSIRDRVSAIVQYAGQK